VQPSAGDTLGPYEIIAQIGAGGMGVVYRARDPRVGRDVAIKVANEHFSNRFEREARAVAALNHANVCTLHDVGPDYLVMELVEGESPKGPLPFETALDIARQIADALDAAHAKGIVHRDLKPGNIKIRSDGTLKVLDFGLATIEAGGTGADIPADSPTMPVGATQAGMILGTAAYMAPEQARGQSVDKRADIWAFGAVFYEMLTGRRAFDGPDVSSIIAAVIQSEPRWDGVPFSVRRLLESCLEKDPRKRLRDIGDVWKLLDAAQKSPLSSSRFEKAGWIAAAALAVVAAMALWAPWRVAPREATPRLVRLDVDLGPELSLLPLSTPTFSSVIISPDGRRLIFVGSVSGSSSRLYARRLDESSITEIAGTQGALNPFFSPDGQWVAFWNGGKLSKVSLEGGAVVPLADLDVMTGGSWADDGSLIVGSGLPNTAGLVRIAPGGGTPTALVKLASGELFHSFPQILPGRNAVLTAVVGTPPSLETTNIDIVSLDDGRRKTLVRGGTSPRYLPSGHVLFRTGAGMFAVPVDMDEGETRGAAVPILGDAAFDPVTGGAQFDVSEGGTLVYRKKVDGAAPTTMRVQWLDRAGKQEALLAEPGRYAGAPRISPDGRRVAMSVRDGANEDIWVYEPQRDTMTRLTLSGATFGNPVWSHDGRYVIFALRGVGMFWTRADGAGQPQALLRKNFRVPTSLTRDGKHLAFTQIDGFPQIWSVDLEADEAGLKAGTPTRFLATQFTDHEAVFSPDGRWVAYQSNESGRPEVYVRPFPASSGKGGKVPISNGGGGRPAWLKHGRTLLYQAGGQIMAVGYATSGGAFVADKPRVWAVNASGSTGFDIAPDGKRLALIVPATKGEEPRREHTVVLVQNFLDELRKRARVGQ